MSEPLLTIGVFARAVGLTTGALRHYAECGLLPPAEVDDLTGYRYYTPDLTQRARLIGAMREVGVPIATMRDVLDGDAITRREAVRDLLDEQTARSTQSAAVLDRVMAELVTTARAPARLTVAGPELAAALRQVKPAADGDAASPLSSVLLDAADGALDVVATDRYWMAIRTLLVGVPSAHARIVLAASTLVELAARLDGLPVAVVTFDNHDLQVDGETFSGRAVPYPAHRMVLAALEPATTHAVLPRDELVTAFAQTEGTQARVVLSSEGARIDGRTVAGTVTGEETTLILGTALMHRALSVTVGPGVQWSLSSPVRPLRLASPSQPDFQALVMPVAND